VNPCLVCGAARWLPLPEPQPARSILSDLRVIGAGLDKAGCLSCGMVRRRSQAAWSFDATYDLYDHPPAWPREDARQSAYASWIAAVLDDEPSSILDVGCGNGSLLLAFRRRWPGAGLHGVDPASRSIVHARDAGVHASTGTLADVGTPADLVVSVNVIEHVTDPVGFLREAGGRATTAGQIVIVCPDGSRPSSELLFADHLWSFTPDHLAALVRQAGMTVAARAGAPPGLGAFQLIRAVPTAPGPDATVSTPAAGDLLDAKRDYLLAWSRLDEILLERAGEAAELICFGIGEAAGLLRAYAPRTWARVTACVADEPECERFGDLHVRAWAGAHAHQTILLGVRPSIHPALATRLEGAAGRVVRWDDIVAA
jgi:SAM-dependent methyltransferase